MYQVVYRFALSLELANHNIAVMQSGFKLFQASAIGCGACGGNESHHKSSLGNVLCGWTTAFQHIDNAAGLSLIDVGQVAACVLLHQAIERVLIHLQFLGHPKDFESLGLGGQERV